MTTTKPRLRWQDTFGIHDLLYGDIWVGYILSDNGQFRWGTFGTNELKIKNHRNTAPVATIEQAKADCVAYVRACLERKE